MKVEHLLAVPTSADEIIRLFEFDPEEARMLMAAMGTWLGNASGALDLEKLPFISRVNCSLRFVVATQDDGIKEAAPGFYECWLTVGTFERMLQLIEPFTTDGAGYQWLYDLDTPIDLLFSPSGKW